MPMAETITSGFLALLLAANEVEWLEGDSRCCLQTAAEPAQWILREAVPRRRRGMGRDHAQAYGMERAGLHAGGNGLSPPIDEGCLVSSAAAVKNLGQAVKLPKLLFRDREGGLVEAVCYPVSHERDVLQVLFACPKLKARRVVDRLDQLEPVAVAHHRHALAGWDDEMAGRIELDPISSVSLPCFGRCGW